MKGAEVIHQIMVEVEIPQNLKKIKIPLITVKLEILQGLM